MDLAFHYFAVKALARKAGFEEEEAQLIAEYSEMVDDFDYYALWHCTNMPNYIRQDGFDIDRGLNFLNPVQTGFLAGGHIVNIDYLLFLSERFQRLTVAPFHFIYHNEEEIGKPDYRVFPAAMNDMSLIWGLLDVARRDYRDSLNGASGNYGDNATFRRKTLMKIGMLLHIFADTTAHQMFSGFNDNVNVVYLDQVINNITAIDETKEYETMIVEFLKKFNKGLPKIGHMMIEHIPDLTHLTFRMKYKNARGEEAFYSRSNTAEFITRSEQILRFLRWCRNEEMVPDKEWRIIQQNLEACFMTDISKCNDEKSMVNMLKPVWSARFDCTFEFSSEDIKKGYTLEAEPLGNDVLMQLKDVPGKYQPKVTTKASRDFYLFNCCAEEVLVYLYGYKPRKLLGDELLYPDLTSGD